MIVTFKTKAYPDIIMFGDVARKLLRMMGQSGHVPGACRATSVGAARQSLQAALDELGPQADASQPDRRDGEPKVTIHQRAFPLLELLAAAERGGRDVIWE